MNKIGDLDIKLREALQKDFEGLYVKEYTTDWKEQRLSRNIELKTMKLDNLEKYVYELLSEKAFSKEELYRLSIWSGDIGAFGIVSKEDAELINKIYKLLDEENEHIKTHKKFLKLAEKQEEWEEELRFTYGHLYYQNEEGEFCQIVNEIDDLIDFISQLLSEKEKEAKQEILRELSYEIDGIKLNKLIDENQEYLNKVGKSLLKQIKLLKDEENERHN